MSTSELPVLELRARAIWGGRATNCYLALLLFVCEGCRKNNQCFLKNAQQVESGRGAKGQERWNLYTRTKTDTCVFKTVRERYLIEIYHEGAEAHRDGLSALHAGEDPIHHTNLCLLRWNV